VLFLLASVADRDPGARRILTEIDSEFRKGLLNVRRMFGGQNSDQLRDVALVVQCLWGYAIVARSYAVGAAPERVFLDVAPGFTVMDARATAIRAICGELPEHHPSSETEWFAPADRAHTLEAISAATLRLLGHAQLSDLLSFLSLNAIERCSIDAGDPISRYRIGQTFAGDDGSFSISRLVEAMVSRADARLHDQILDLLVRERPASQKHFFRPGWFHGEDEETALRLQMLQAASIHPLIWLYNLEAGGRDMRARNQRRFITEEGNAVAAAVDELYSRCRLVLGRFDGASELEPITAWVNRMTSLLTTAVLSGEGTEPAGQHLDERFVDYLDTLLANMYGRKLSRHEDEPGAWSIDVAGVHGISILAQGSRGQNAVTVSLLIAEDFNYNWVERHAELLMRIQISDAFPLGAFRFYPNGRLMIACTMPSSFVSPETLDEAVESVAYGANALVRELRGPLL
jgi:hypothetical protein